ncbi:MAG: alpha/beta hydrolase, partial [Verrucomicrobiales bacterium]|nr:alpha/beta hydrolase [Verrucomicrobiales bacterium]
MERRKRILLVVAASLVLLLVLAGVWFWHSLGKPLYQPGMVRVGANLRGPLEPPPKQQDDSFWIVEPDIRLHHFSQGQGRPVLVVHGGPGYPITKPLPGLEPLTAKFQFHYYDQRGSGQSSRPFGRFTSKNFYANMTELERTLGIGAQVADIERIRRILKQEKLVLLGHSFGAFLAAMYATEFPEHVQALVLVAPSAVLVVPGEGPDFFDEIRRRLPESRHAEYDQFLKAYLDFGRLFDNSEEELAAANRQIGDYFLLASGQAVSAERPPDANGGWMVQAMYLSLGKRHDYRPMLRLASAPTLVIHGEDDIVPEQGSRGYVEALP